MVEEHSTINYRHCHLYTMCMYTVSYPPIIRYVCQLNAGRQFPTTMAKVLKNGGHFVSEFVM